MSFAATTLKNGAARRAVLKVLGRVLQSEVSSLCSTTVKSVLAVKPKEVLGDFHGTIRRLMDEMGMRAPNLLSLLRWCLKTRQPRGNTDSLIAMITSIMCKHRKASVC